MQSQSGAVQVGVALVVYGMLSVWMFPCRCWILRDPLELARRIPSPCFCIGGRRIAVHTQPVFKNKTKPHSCCLSERGKRLFLLLLKLLKSVEQEGCDSCRWEGESAFQLIRGEISPGLFSRLDFISAGIEVTRCFSLSLSPGLQSDGASSVQPRVLATPWVTL